MVRMRYTDLISNDRYDGASRVLTLVVFWRSGSNCWIRPGYILSTATLLPMARSAFAFKVSMPLSAPRSVDWKPPSALMNSFIKGMSR